MKKALIVLIPIALLIWIATWFRAPETVATSGAKPWPGGMGTLDKAVGRYPKLKANEASRKLMALAKALPPGDAITGYVGREMARGELTIANPPALPDVSAIRELLRREPIVWELSFEIGDADTQTARGVQMTVARALVASALAKAHANDAAAWEDLHAVWKLARSLDGHPVVMSQTAALSMARMINAVAWKMPLPAPEWLGEVQQRDNVRPLLEAFQVQSATYYQDQSRVFPTKVLAASVDKDRGIAEALFNATNCDVNTLMNDLGTDLRSVWRRAFRYRAEREATANALRVRDGKPIVEKSVCSDGRWSFDGTTLRFSREIGTEPPDTPMPLVLRVTAKP